MEKLNYFGSFNFLIILVKKKFGGGGGGIGG